jgi:hypothetical protein
MVPMSPAALFDHYNRLGAHVDKAEPGESLPGASFGTCDQVRVLAQSGPKVFVIVWWSPWPEGEARAMHVVDVVGLEPHESGITLVDRDGARWTFTQAEGEYAASVAAYHAHQAGDPEFYAELEKNAIEAASSDCCYASRNCWMLILPTARSFRLGRGRSRYLSSRQLCCSRAYVASAMIECGVGRRYNAR